MSRHLRRHLLLLALALATLGTAGCGLFSTGVPDPPFVDAGIPPNFTTPESTLATIARAIGSRSATNYGQALADTILESREFHAAFDPADIAVYLQTHPSAPADWRREAELSFFNQFVANFEQRYDTYFFVDEERGGIIDIGGATQKKIYNMHYRVWAGSNAVVAGSAGINFERVGLGGEYKITYWEDHRDTANVRTWGSARLLGR
jgi:hypothetical protein